MRCKVDARIRCLILFRAPIPEANLEFTGVQNGGYSTIFTEFSSSKAGVGIFIAALLRNVLSTHQQILRVKS